MPAQFSLTPEQRDCLYKARWYLTHGHLVPEGGPLENLQGLLAATLGVPNPVTPSLSVAPAFDAPPAAPLPAIVFPREKWLAATGKLPVIGQPLLVDEFPRYLAGLRAFGVGEWTWKPVGVTIHHMASPSLADRPRGIEPSHMANLRNFYLGLGWSAAPHLFVDEDQIWLFSPLTEKGIHAVAFNRSHIGLEMLGDYDDEDPWSGRGLQVLTTTAFAVAVLCRHFGWTPEKAVNFHRDDPGTSKTCPGKRVTRELFLTKVREFFKS